MCMRPAVCSALTLGNFFIILLIGTRDVPDSKFVGYWISGKSTLPDIRHRAAARWLPTTDLQQCDFAIFFENAFRGKSRKIFRFCSLKFIQKKLPKYRVKRSKK